jgi:hypothetical protein
VYALVRWPRSKGGSLRSVTLGFYGFLNGGSFNIAITFCKGE